MPATEVKDKILWVRAVLNGILAWVLGFIIYMIPALVVATKMGFELGPQSDDPAAVSEQISQAIPAIYESNPLLTIGFIIVTALLIFWRAKAVANATGNKRTINGLLVAVFPVLISVLFSVFTNVDFTSIIQVLLFFVAGFAGGYLSKTATE